MHILDKEIYYCKSCKKVSDSLDSLLFVEEGSPVSFCSEDCIEQFYSPLVDFFNKEMTKTRSDMGLLDEPALDYLESPSLVQKHMKRPDEIYRFENQLKEEFYALVSKFENEGDKFEFISLCFIFNKAPSFIFAITSTSDSAFAALFKRGEKIDSISDFYESQIATELQIDEEVMKNVEFKKNSFLAEHLELRKDFDIPFEKFELYIDYFEKTLETPDELYLGEDEEGDEQYIYIKAFEKDGTSFFYLVVCRHELSEDGEHNIVMPIMSFPTIDGDLCEHYRKGKQVSGNLKN